MVCSLVAGAPVVRSRRAHLRHAACTSSSTTPRPTPSSEIGSILRIALSFSGDLSGRIVVYIRPEMLVPRTAALAAIKADLFALFTQKDAHARGKALEGVLNRLFKAFEILIREDFTLRTERQGHRR